VLKLGLSLGLLHPDSFVAVTEEAERLGF